VSDSNLPQLHTRQELENARTKGQVIGWVQGAVVAVGGMLLAGLIGWIPALAIAGVVAYGLYRLMRPRRG
jgi:MFS superfamily sulfate permease-like transporter